MLHDVTYEDVSYALIVLKKKLIIIVLVLFFGIAVSFQLMNRVINNINNTILPEGATIIYLSPLEVMLLKFKMSLIVGVLLIIPVIAYYAYSAVKSRLENKNTINIPVSRLSLLFIGITALALFLLGAGYSYFLMLPLFIQYLFENAASAGVVATYSVAQFISFVALTTVIFGLVFEFPLILVILLRTGIVKRSTLTYYRRHVYVGLLVLAAIITPPDVFSQIIIAVPMMVFYEMSLLLGRFVKPKHQ